MRFGGRQPNQMAPKTKSHMEKNTQETFPASPQLSTYIDRIIPLYVPIRPVVGKITISPSNPT